MSIVAIHTLPLKLPLVHTSCPHLQCVDRLHVQPDADEGLARHPTARPMHPRLEDNLDGAGHLAKDCALKSALDDPCCLDIIVYGQSHLMTASGGGGEQREDASVCGQIIWLISPHRRCLIFFTFMIGVLMFFAPLMISLIRGTPRVTFILATPAKWKVLRVIWVPGSPMDWAPTAPTVEPEDGGRDRKLGNRG